MPPPPVPNSCLSSRSLAPFPQRKRQPARLLAALALLALLSPRFPSAAALDAGSPLYLGAPVPDPQRQLSPPFYSNSTWANRVIQRDVRAVQGFTFHVQMAGGAIDSNGTCVLCYDALTHSSNDD